MSGSRTLPIHLPCALLREIPFDHRDLPQFIDIRPLCGCVCAGVYMMSKRERCKQKERKRTPHTPVSGHTEHLGFLHLLVVVIPLIRCSCQWLGIDRRKSLSLMPLLYVQWQSCRCVRQIKTETKRENLFY